MTFKITKEHFINRDLSWIDFNARVLEEAGDKSNPVMERLKFIAIFSNNLDEFFMVRVAGLKQQLDAGDVGTDPSGIHVKTQLAMVRKKIIPLLARQHGHLHREILPELEKNGLVLLPRYRWDSQDRKELKNIFERQIFPALTPIAVDPSHPFPVLTSGAIEIGITLKHHQTGETVRAFVEVPGVLPRFIPIRSAKHGQSSVYVFLEDIIIDNISSLFSKCEITETILFRITRDMDFTIDEEGVADLLLHLEKKLLQRRRSEPLRLELIKGASSKLDQWLTKVLGLDASDKYYVEGPLHLANFFSLVARENRPEICEPSWPALENPAMNEDTSVFDSIKQQGTLPMFLPYQNFDPIVRLIEEAGDDPDVLAIKQTLYRVSGNSPVVRALIRAAANNKQVTVIVELKARFDEEHNIQWARQLEEAGAHVIYGMAGLKIHAKALLIIRREDGIIRRYVHLSTGNYNDKTAKVYTDIGIMSNDPELCSDIAALFNVMTGYSAKPEQWNKIAAAPFDLREKFLSLIDREARLSTRHSPGRIIAKINSLVHPDIIEHLYMAAHAGVKIDLIVRGICCLKPGIKTKNINITSIVDRYLEHTRIYYFANGGNEEYYLSSADWMPRNLHRRIEVLFPVNNSALEKILREILQFSLNEKFKSRKLLPSGVYTKSVSKNRQPSTRSQRKIYDFLKNLLPPKKNQAIKILENVNV